MLSNPRIGQRVRVHYAKHYCDMMPLHGKVGIVRVRATGRPRNHGIEIDGHLFTVPAGNLMKA